jgi:hypothetical protein
MGLSPGAVEQMGSSDGVELMWVDATTKSVVPQLSGGSVDSCSGNRAPSLGPEADGSPWKSAVPRILKSAAQLCVRLTAFSDGKQKSVRD